MLAQQARQLIKVGSAGRGGSADLARDLGMAPWQVDKARRALGGWTADALATCVTAIAAADFEVKGGGRDPVYAVERCVLTITDQHARNRADGDAGLRRIGCPAQRHPPVAHHRALPPRPAFWCGGRPAGNFGPCVRA